MKRTKKTKVQMGRALARAFGVLAGKFRRGEITVAEWKAGLDKLSRDYPDPRSGR